jgi:hypothetical protein
MQAPAVRAADDPLGMELPVHLAGRGRGSAWVRVRPRVSVRRVTGVPALAAWPMTGRQRDCLVMEEQPGESPREPLLVPAILEPQRADDPQVTGMEAHDPPALMQTPAIASERSAQRERRNVPQRGHPILISHGRSRDVPRARVIV